jgi:hypothetical protein
MIKPLVIVLNWGEDGGGNLTNVQYDAIWNCHNEFPLYNEYILIKNEKKLSMDPTYITIRWGKKLWFGIAQ